ncbi:ElyC/SanA/YdcF family protein [Nonomuraea longispora]|uniref:ElyC/SanA/YdcF family protein n=1 Tax=Nonomuraea longispora TaxID=1848320 RepID=UPI001FE444C9|nr:ElyC/SanA/YdcF family protein [Nonomuraea longispora]
MTTVHEWTGLEAHALRLALRMSVRVFAQHLGVAPRTVAKWNQLGSATRPRPDTQAILDTALARADSATHLRFETLLLELGQDADQGLRVTRVGPRAWDYETWTDDLDRVVVALSRQSFNYAADLLNRWLARYDPHALDDKGLYLFARSTTLLGDLQRDQGAVAGPLSARRSYLNARSIYGQLDIPRRIAQLDLSLAVVTEMSGGLDEAAREYEALAVDDRLSPRDRTRARLWVGTALSKNDRNDYAARLMTTAIREFESLGEPEDWSVAHQKLALAHRGAGNLPEALRLIDLARATAVTDAPMQRVRLETAYGHILLSDRATVDDGLMILDRAAREAAQHGLAHQLRSIEGIQQTIQRENERLPLPRRSGSSQVSVKQQAITDEQWRHARTIWDYHQMHHDLRRCDVAIGLGSHDLGVARAAVDLYRAGWFPLLVFSGATSPTTATRFPRGEAVHYREHALELGMPDETILLEPNATNTGQNIALSHQVLADAGIEPCSVLLISKPYMERRAYATARKVWPEVEVVCASEPLVLNDYVSSIGDPKLVIDMLVGDLQRVIQYPKLGYAIEQPVPGEVHDAYQSLVRAGFDSRLLTS